MIEGLALAAQGAWPAPCAVMVVGDGCDEACRLLRSLGYAAQARATLTGDGERSPALLLLADQVRVDAVAMLELLGLRLAAGEASVLVADPRESPSRRLSAIALIEVVARRLDWTVAKPASGWTLLRRPAKADREFRWVAPDRSADMRAQFQNIFGQGMSEALWRWKYAEGQGVGLGLWREGRLLAHYGGMVRDVRAFGRSVRACQVCDVMVAADARAALARRGPLVQITSTFLEHQIGWDLPCRIGFGFPSDRHFGVAHHLGLYDAVDEMLMLAWPISPMSSRLGPSWQVEPIAGNALRPGSWIAARVDQLWSSMASDFSGKVIGVRDAAWLRHRYVDRPDAEYRTWAVCSGILRRWIGVVVTRDYGTHTELMDVVGQPRHFDTLLSAARQVAAQSGSSYLHAWITASQLPLLQHPGEDGTRPLPQKLGILVPANAHNAGPAPSDFVGRWFLMSGDTDFR